EEVKQVAGIPLNRKEFKRALKTADTPFAHYTWSAGHAVGRFLAGLKEGRILGVRCTKCERVLVPPRAFCEECFVPVDDWVELSDTGRVNTFAISYLDTMTRRIKDPIIPAVIEIDGASPDIGIMHLLGEVDPDKVRIGMRVKAVWKPPEEREGAITDIKYFKPV
ncbi:MAG: Zn-ribbon domain-containing OB-fold protein, partial [Nitrospinota bacterium]